MKKILPAAVKHGHLELINYAIASRADVIQSFDQYTNKFTLIIAIKRGDLEIVDLLCRNGADPSSKERLTRAPALIVAVKKKRFDIAEVILSYGAVFNAKDGSGKTAIDYAPNEMKKLSLLVKLKN